MDAFRKILATGALVITTALSMQASALPIFTFTEYGGFTPDVGMAKYTNPVTGDASLIPAASPVYSTMTWTGSNPQRSSLQLHTVEDPSALMANTWTTISTLYHYNQVTQGSVSWFGQDIWGRLIISDANGGLRRVADSDSVISINMTETKNTSSCASPNPVGTKCDDFFTITTPIDNLFFSANDGSQWMAEFRFANLVNAAQVENLVFTGEGTTGSVDVQVLVSNIASARGVSAASAIPEPATLVLFGLGLIGLAIARRRTANAMAVSRIK